MPDIIINLYTQCINNKLQPNTKETASLLQEHIKAEGRHGINIPSYQTTQWHNPEGHNMLPTVHSLRMYVTEAKHSILSPK
jgi:hypothetical protein